MSKIKLPHSSGNSMAIAAPATNPASDLELKLPATIGTANQILANSGTAGLLEFITQSDNTPAFYAYQSSSQTVPTNDWQHMTVDTEVLDTDGAFASSSFTVPSGGAGKYVLLYGTGFDGLDDGENMQMKIHINNVADVTRSYTLHYSPGSNKQLVDRGNCVADLAVGNVVRFYGYQHEGGNLGSEASYTYFAGFRISGY